MPGPVARALARRAGREEEGHPGLEARVKEIPDLACPVGQEAADEQDAVLLGKLVHLRRAEKGPTVLVFALAAVGEKENPAHIRRDQSCP